MPIWPLAESFSESPSARGQSLNSLPWYPKPSESVHCLPFWLHLLLLSCPVSILQPGQVAQWPQMALWFPTDICIHKLCAVSPHQLESRLVFTVCTLPEQAHHCKSRYCSHTQSSLCSGPIPCLQDWVLREQQKCWLFLWRSRASKMQSSWKRYCHCSGKQNTWSMS